MSGLRAQAIERVYDSVAGLAPVRALRPTTIELMAADALAITGPSGCGKSTLLHILGTLERPSSGRLEFDGVDPFALTEPALARFRNSSIGFVFQDHHLLPQYTVLENAVLPTLAFGAGRRDAAERARHLLDRVGLGDRLGHRPSELSGGERQRVAVARALVNRPKLILCDEPTGSLDQETARSVAALLLELHAEAKAILVIVTHSEALASRLPRRMALAAG